MRLNHPVRYLISLTLLVCTVSCFSPAISLTEQLPPDTAQVPLDSTFQVEDSVATVTTDSLLRNMLQDDEFLDTSLIVRMEKAALILETAQTYLDLGEIQTAGWTLILARAMIATIDSSALDDSTAEFYQDILTDIENFFDDYVARTPELPAEASPEAVIAGYEWAEGDTIPTLDDILFIPSSEVDTTDLAEALRTVVPLPQVPLVRNRRVDGAIRYFQTGARKVYARWLKRAEYTVPMMTRILREEGIPDEVVYISMIESGFNLSAYSYAHAAGPWQFIKSTGKIFGLKTNRWYDERRDPVKATRAACRYLRKLYMQFGDWHLAFAAYNCGEGLIDKRLRQAGVDDFWKLKRLPKQTLGYVPTYVAATIIAKNPTEYGFEPVSYRLPDPVDSVWVTEAVDLRLAASLVGSDYQTLKSLNPWCLKWCTPPDESLWLILPDSTAEKFTTGYAALPDDQKKISYTIHTVKRGETLAKIAKKYGTTTQEILAIKDNQWISNPKSLPIGKDIFLPVSLERYQAGDPIEQIIQDAPSEREDVVYSVRKGDNLTEIARKFGTTVSAIKANNKLYGKNPRIMPGQRLVIKTRKGSAASAGLTADEATPSKPTITSHKVSRGETPASIAAKYGMTAKELMAKNGIRDARKLKAGMRLKVTKNGDDDDDDDEAAPTVHIVKRGDTVGKIAAKYRVKQSELIRVNGLRANAVIKPGDRLKIPGR
jgi:membrane-bound lytic murein transglycosylase D